MSETAKVIYKEIVCMLSIFIFFNVVNLAFAQTRSLKKTELLFDYMNKASSYQEYIKKYSNFPRPRREIFIQAVNYKSFSKNSIKILTNLTENNHPVLYTSDDGYVEWEFKVEQDGLYNIAIKYYPIKGKNSTIERELLIDGKRPFNESRILKFERIWRDKALPLKDNRGNELRPVQIEEPQWIEKTLEDSEGLYTQPFLFYLSKGKHTIRLVSVKEPMVIDYIKICNQSEVSNYENVKKEYERKGYTVPKGIFVKIQAERAKLKSEPTLYPISDRTNPLNEPYSPRKTVLNIIGGYNWRNAGQWIEWEFEVPQDGLYKIGLKFRQNSNPGIPAERTLYIDGKIPFKEVSSIKFKYDTNWQFMYIGNIEDEPYLFYLKKGKHRLRLKISYSSIADIVRTVQQSSIDLSQLYTKIVMITGSNPDPLRDYLLEEQIPELISTLTENAKILRNESKKIKDIGGKNVSEAAVLERVALQLESMAKEPDTIPQRLQKFRDNLSSLATWTLTIREQPIDLDYLVIASPEQEKPKVVPNLIEKLVDGVKKFFISFVENYNMIGTVYDKEKSINVWVQLGRDQAETLKMLIDSDFTPKTGIGVNLNIIPNESVLLFSVASKENPPDVALNVPRSLAVDYGMRGALVDVSKLPGFNEVKKWFAKNALVPYSFEGKVYGLPLTEDFPIMFYRVDIFNKLGLKVPDTWDELYEVISKLQEHNLQFGAGTGSTTSFDFFNLILLQNGGRYYTADGKRCILNNEAGVQSFTEWTNFYVLYGVPLYYEFYNRFRTGEMPLGIVNYTLYNQLKVAAPEISGLWKIAPIPGKKKSDGSIDRSVAGNGTAVLIFNQSKKLKEAWEFVKWWLSADIQARYGKELEAILGAGARYNTANVEALSFLPWPSEDYKVLMEQWKYLNEIPNVPGSYYATRHIDNAFREVVMNGELPREVIEKYTKEINKEIDRKREEFGLPIAAEK